MKTRIEDHTDNLKANKEKVGIFRHMYSTS